MIDIYAGIFSYKGNVEMRFYFIASLQLIILLSTFTATDVHASSAIRGIVLDENGMPLENASISVWLRNKRVAVQRSNSDGYFEIELDIGSDYTLYIFADNSSTPGIDYIPSRYSSISTNIDVLEVTLEQAASLVIEGEIQFVESEKIPLSLLYSVIDPKSNNIICINDLPLSYGYAPESQSTFLGLESSHLIVPTDVPIIIAINSTINTESGHEHRCFKAGEDDNFILERGQLITIDVSHYSIFFNLRLVETLHDEVESRIGDMESLGFYLTTEKRMATSSLTQLSEAKYLYENNRYIESFEMIKRSFIEIRQTLTDVERLYNDAALSVYTLILFMNFVAISIALLLFKKDSTKLMGSFVIYPFLLIILYVNYPGSVIIPLQLFIGSAALALVASFIAVKILPRLMSGKRRDDYIPISNIIVPILSIAKRNIKRRKLKFGLTLSSIVALVTSFVVLTSFSRCYGLVLNRLDYRSSQSNVVMFRDPNYYKAEPTFLTTSDIRSGWLDGISECRVISPKAENLPVVQPVAHLNASPIFGIIGINPVAESAIIDLQGVLIKGKLPSEGGVLVSEALMMKLKLEVGDELVLSDLMNKQTNIRLQGVFDDNAFSELRDIDGVTYLPMKLLDVTPEASPTFLPALCDPSEIIIVNLSTALTMPLVGITRVDIAVGEATDVKVFAERLALERGYKVWFSSADGVYFTKLGGYMEVKALPLIVPWVIVTLNVMMTMLNSIYERKKEISILSSVGLNPNQISTIFIAEASIIGIIAGGTGYLIGLSLYKIIVFFGLAIEVRQKISALWSIATICIALSAVATGTIPVLKNSTDITPSSMRRWRIDESRFDADEPFEITIPVKILPEGIDAFSDFVVHALKAHKDPVRKISSVTVFTDEHEGVKNIGFVYKATTSLDAGTFYTNNILIIEKMHNEDIEVRLQSDGSKKHVYITGNLMRMFAMQWSTTRGKPMRLNSEN